MLPKIITVINADVRFFRSPIGDSLNYEDTVKDGEGIIVDIDKTKYHRSHRFDFGLTRILTIIASIERSTTPRNLLTQLNEPAQILLKVNDVHLNIKSCQGT
ncbi:hypothetical protein HZS_2925 [Henneguya salminicola]|nr:hypothetical protein HZS_2925 [Henneguya salminicola]